MSTMRNRRVLVMTAVEAERAAVLRGLRGDARFEVALAGVGPAMAAARTAWQLASADRSNEEWTYDLVVSAGIGGGFADRAEIGSLVVASEIIAADLGAESPEQLLTLDDLGFGTVRVAVDLARAERLHQRLSQTGLQTGFGPVLTVSTATGTETTASRRAARFEGAAAEAMEGYGVAVAAQQRGLPMLEIRAISNLVGPRDRSAWRIPEALAALEAASACFAETLLDKQRN